MQRVVAPDIELQRLEQRNELVEELLLILLLSQPLELSFLQPQRSFLLAPTDGTDAFVRTPAPLTICHCESVLRESVIRAAVQPSFSWFSRGNHRVMAYVRMSSRMPIGRRVAT